MDFRAFEATPGISVIVRPDPPVYTHVAVSNDFIRAVGMEREAVIGKGHFEIFPKSPDDLDFTGELNLRTSFDYIIQHQKPHEIPLQRYDIPNGDGTFSQKYWRINNAPIVSDTGEVLYIIHSALDITEQVQAEQKADAVKGIENAYNLFMAAPVIIGILKGDDYIIELANEGLLEVWGRTTNVVGKPLLKAIPELGDQGIIPLLEQVRTTGEPFYAYAFPIELVRHGKEEVVYFDFIYKPIYENPTDTKASGIISVGHDVTEQVLARKKAEESEHRFKELITGADIATAVYVGREMTIQYANEAMLRLWGKDASVIGKTVRQALPELEGQPFHQQLDQVYTTGITYWGKEDRGEIMVNGRLQTFYFNFSYKALRNADGEIYGILNMATDVTEQVKAKQRLVESERNLRNTILQAPVAMCIMLGPAHVVDIANDAMIELWGKPKENVIHKPIFEGLPDAREQGLEQILDNVYQTGTPFRGFEHPVKLLRNGKTEVVFQNFVYEPYKDADGNILGVLAISIDVTQQVLARQKIEEVVVQRTQELAQANASLLKSNEELKRSNANLEEFAHAASHDMKEPLRKVLTFSDRIKTSLNDRLTETEKRYFERMENATQRMGLLVDDLLEYSHVSERPLQTEVVNLEEKLRRVLTDLELLVEEKKAKIIIEKLPVVNGYKRQLQQLFQNLVGNALKYSKPGVPPEIAISSRTLKGANAPIQVLPEQLEQKFYLIEVKDNGIGFEPQYAERIFGMFQRLHGKSEYAGTGVGLSIARKVVDNHNGYIWATGQPGEGATFHVLLPVAV